MAQYETTDSRGPGKPYAARNVENAEVAEPGPALSCMQPDLTLISQVLGGTRAMREAGRDRLPQHEYESDPAYKKRLNVTVLDNYTLRTLNTLVGKAFKEPPAIGEDAPEPLQELMEDVDDAGTGLVPFARQWFRKGTEQAVCHMLVDMPTPAPREDGQPRTKADDLKDGMRPLWRLITAEDMLDLQEGKVNGTVDVVLARFRDDQIEADGKFKSKLVKRVKVLRRDDVGVTWEVWEYQAGPRGGKPRWVQTQPETPYGLDRIPIVSFYTNKTGTGEGRPELTDLADLNVRHWQSMSDQINALTVARFPILAASGVRDAEGEGQGGQLVVGPNKFLTTPDPQSKVYFVEHTGAAIDKGEGELDRLEEAMASYGASFLKKGAQGPETASGRILDNAEATSPLQSWGIDFKDCLERAGWLTALWMGMPDDTEVPFEFEVEDDAGAADAADMSTIDAARTRRDISRRAWVTEAQRRGILSDDYNPDDDQGELDDEPPPAGGGLDGMFGGRPPVEKKPPAKKTEPPKPKE